MTTASAPSERASSGPSIHPLVLLALAGALLSPSTTEPFVPDWLASSLCTLVVAVGCAVTLVRDAVARPDRATWTLLVALGCAVLAGWALTGGWQLAQTGEVDPALRLVRQVLVPALLLSALLLVLRRVLRGMGLVVGLDGLCGALAGLAAVTAAAAPFAARVEAATGQLPVPIVAVTNATLLAVTLGAVGVMGRNRAAWLRIWALGLLVLGTGNATLSYQLGLGAYTPGRWLDAAWPLAIVLVTFGVTRLPESSEVVVPTSSSLVVVSSSAVLGVAALAAAPSLGAPGLPAVIALLALAACATRLTLVFLQLRELALVREMALTDELTGVPNRRALYQALDDLFPSPDTGPPARFALALLDLDQFKAVNDSFGHATGDELLQAVVGRFSTALDELRTPHLLARLGGDEFAVIFYEADSFNAAMACGSALQESLVEPIALREVVLHARASIGIASAPAHGRSRADLLFAADAAMYAAKTSGEPVKYHAPEAVGDRRQRLFVAEDLYAALQRDELTVDYQPIVSCDGRLCGAEALVRWDHPTRGRLSPDDFLEAAERYKLTPAIAQRVLDVTLGDLARWRSVGAEVSASINVSATDLNNEGLVQLVASAILKHGVPPESVTIEITETAMMHDAELARTIMESLSSLGVHLSVDDYGTGYSSLEYLLRLPINEIKLDRAFCSNLLADRRAAAIVRSTLDLTHALGLRMVAEGVEDADTLDVLRRLDCDRVQGWHVGRPMPAQAFGLLVDQLVLDGRDLVLPSGTTDGAVPDRNEVFG